MPQIDFYILPDHTAQGRLLLACRLAEKAYTHRHKVYIHTPNHALAEQLDDLLWTFRQHSFVPHALYPPAPGDTSPVLIGYHSQPMAPRDVLLNLGSDIPDFSADFQRVIELVDQDEQTLQQSRQRFRYYRERGYEPVSHRL
jgi:DNA polymerase-3 subunit chi